jgi:predicted TIM-barrel fold metal-dependent hydrolase
MRIVDSHCHVAANWFEPIESLLDQMDHLGIDHAVLVQDSVQFDNEYLFECMRRYPGRIAAVISVDVGRPDACETLRRLAARGASGLRLHQADRSPGADPYAIWRTAAELRLAVSCHGRSPYYGSVEFADLVRTFPSLRIVVEHLGSGNTPDAESVPPEIRDNVFKLARFSNVYVKIHGLGEFCRRIVPASTGFPFERPIPPLLERAYEAFGPSRMMWGSDYPPVSAREGFGNALRLTMERFSDASEADRSLIFGEVALRLFPVV